MCEMRVVVTDESLPDGKPWVWLVESHRVTWFVHRPALLADPESVVTDWAAAAGAVFVACRAA